MLEAVTGGGPQGTTRHIVLLVDDEALVLNYIKRALLAEGHQVICASNGLEALARLKAFAVDLVITDIRMPEMGGLELGAYISQLPGAPVVIYASASDRPPPSAAGHYLQKPFSVAELIRMVREALSARAEGMRRLALDR